MKVTDYQENLLLHTAELKRLSNMYHKERTRYGELEGELHILLATKINEYRKGKKNLGIEMAFLMLIADNPDLSKDFKEFKVRENNYKALEKLINAQESAIMAFQSIMKYNAHQDTFGKEEL